MKRLETKRRNKRITLICYLLFFLLLPLYIMAGNKNDSINLSGKWYEGKKELCEEYPISAAYDSSFLYIESTSQRSDITVRILKNTETILEDNVNAEELPIMIPISSLQNGSTYTLELTNQWGDRLVGDFIIR